MNEKDKIDIDAVVAWMNEHLQRQQCPRWTCEGLAIPTEEITKETEHYKSVCSICGLEQESSIRFPMLTS
jgi:hypothetical protein